MSVRNLAWPRLDQDGVSRVLDRYAPPATAPAAQRGVHGLDGNNSYTMAS